jgi:DNA-binding NarL/FixJ family response regulator
MSAKILIVDDHEIVRKGIRNLVEQSRPEWRICGEAVSGAEAVRLAKAAEPDVIILDVAMPEMSGIEAASRIARLHLDCRVLLFTMYESKRLTAAALQAGAQGYVLKSQAAHHLIQAIDCILAGGTFFGGPQSDPEPEKDESSDGGFLRCKDLGYCGI